MSEETKREKFNKEIKEILDNFQKILDGSDMTIIELQNWCGHMNSVMNTFIMEVSINFQKLKDANLLEDTVEIEPFDERKDYGGFYI